MIWKLVQMDKKTKAGLVSYKTTRFSYDDFLFSQSNNYNLIGLSFHGRHAFAIDASK